MTQTSTSTATPIATDAFVLHDEDRAAIAHERDHYPHPQAASIEALKIENTFNKRRQPLRVRHRHADQMTR